MKQYISKSAVVAAIERRIASLESIGTEDYLHDIFPKQYAMLVTLKSLKLSIDKLEVKELEEQPANRELEEEFVSYVKEKFGIRQEGAVLKTDGLTISPYDLLDFAKYFAQWQKQRVADKACEWLEENIDKYIYITGEYDGYKMFEDFKNILKEL